MGHQSYTVIYTNKEELKKILDAINEYQKIANGIIDTDEEIGEVIKCVCFTRVRNMREVQDRYILLFGIGGGRGYCEQFFWKRGVVLGYFSNDKTLKVIEDHSKWFNYDDHFDNEGLFTSFTDEFIEVLEHCGYVSRHSMDIRRKLLRKIRENKTYWNDDVKNMSDDELDEIIEQIALDKYEKKLEKKEAKIK